MSTTSDYIIEYDDASVCKWCNQSISVGYEDVGECDDCIAEKEKAAWMRQTQEQIASLDNLKCAALRLDELPEPARCDLLLAVHRIERAFGLAS